MSVPAWRTNRVGIRINWCRRGGDHAVTVADAVPGQGRSMLVTINARQDRVGGGERCEFATTTWAANTSSYGPRKRGGDPLNDPPQPL
jgi:hypothetical protein